MPYNGSGSFSAPSASFPAVSGALIESAKFNNIVNDITSGLSNAITKDGQTTITANLPMSNYRHTGVGNAVARTDYASAGQVQDSSLMYAGTAGGTANAITLSLTPPITAYTSGQSFTYKSSASVNTGAMTVNINSLGVKAIQRNGSALVGGDHPASRWFRITYDGTAFQLEQISAPGVIPAFSARSASSQSITSGVITQVTLGTEEIDTASCFASSRFTPNVAGYYFITGVISGTATNMTGLAAYIYKNNTAFRAGDFIQFDATSSSFQISVSALVELNGSTDYVDLRGIITGTTPSFDFVSSSDCSAFSGFLVRAL